MERYQFTTSTSTCDNVQKHRKQHEKKNRTYSQKHKNYPLYDFATHNKNQCVLIKSQEHLQQDTQDYDIVQGSNNNATKDQDKFYTHETSPQNIHNYCVQQDSNSLATKHLKIISKEDSFASEQDPSYSNNIKNMPANNYSRKIFSQRNNTLKRPHSKTLWR